MYPVQNRLSQLGVRILAKIQGVLYRADHVLFKLYMEHNNRVLLFLSEKLGYAFWRLADALGPDDGP
jgi:hypothetical protein